MLGLGLDAWTNLMVASLGVAALAAIFGWASTYFISRLQKAEALAASASFERYKLGVEGRVADAAKKGIEAGKAAGDALVRAAQLEKDAENARLEAERIKSAVAWRVIPPESAQQFEKHLSAKPGSVNLRYMDGDPEALYLAIQLSQIFVKAHWQVAPGSIKPANTIVFGIMMPHATSTDAAALASALSAAKVGFTRGDVPQAGVSFAIQTIDGAPTLIVGSRLPTVP
jgi:hypothetical protein